MTKSKDENSYRNILKGISVFGSVKVFEVLAGIVRVKFVAMLLGPDGMGINTLFTSAALPIQQFSSLGLNLAIVQEVASRREDPSALRAAFSAAGRLIIFTALLGALVCLAAAPWLSVVTFGSDAYTWQFMLLSISVFLAIGSTGRLSLLQGLHEVKRLSTASLIGGLTGLLAGVPLYYFFGTHGIVPALIAGNLALFIFYAINLKRCEAVPEATTFSWQTHRLIVKRLIALGFILMASDLIGSVCTYATNIYIRVFSDESVLGLFQAANTLTNQYAGMVFTAMSLDFFPRLTAIARDNRKMCEVVNRQTEIVALLIAPLAILLILTAPLAIQLLYTDKFLPATGLMRWMGVGVMVKALMFPMGYIAFAKDNRKLFFWLEGVYGNLLTMLAFCLMFTLFGFDGLGYGFVADCVICIATYYIVNRRKYGYRFDRRTLLLCGYAATTVTGAFFASYIPSKPLSYTVGGSILLLTGLISLKTILSLTRKKRIPVDADNEDR